MNRQQIILTMRKPQKLRLGVMTKTAKEARKSRPIRMTDAEWEKCKTLGGAAFVRAKIKVGRRGGSKARRCITHSSGAARFCAVPLERKVRTEDI